jgi:hypothetical protein
MRAAMNRSRSGLIIRSWVETRNHDGSVVHAGGPAGSNHRKPSESGWVWAEPGGGGKLGVERTQALTLVGRERRGEHQADHVLDAGGGAGDHRTAVGVAGQDGGARQPLGQHVPGPGHILGQRGQRQLHRLNPPKQAVNPNSPRTGSCDRAGWQPFRGEVAGGSPALWEAKPPGPPWG